MRKYICTLCAITASFCGVFAQQSVRFESKRFEFLIDPVSVFRPDKFSEIREPHHFVAGIGNKVMLRSKSPDHNFTNRYSVAVTSPFTSTSLVNGINAMLLYGREYSTGFLRNKRFFNYAGYDWGLMLANNSTDDRDLRVKKFGAPILVFTGLKYKLNERLRLNLELGTGIVFDYRTARSTDAQMSHVTTRSLNITGMGPQARIGFGRVF